MARDTKPMGGHSESALAYDVGELDLASTPLELGGPVENQQRGFADEDAHFYASLPSPTHSAHDSKDSDHEHDSERALWADLPSLELAHDPRNDVGQSVRRPPTPVPTAAPAAAPSPNSAGLEPSASADVPALGLAPNAVWETPLYAVRALVFAVSVWRARRALEREQARARSAFDAALTELGRTLLTLRDRPELAPLQSKFQSIDEKRGQRASVDGALRELHVSRAAQEETLDAELTRIKEELLPFEQRSEVAQKVLRQAETDAGRAEAQAKRAEIALRAAKQASSLPTGTNLEELERALLERRTELGQARDIRGRAQGLRDDAARELEQQRDSERLHGQKRLSLVQESDRRASSLGKRAELVGVSEEAALRMLALAARELKLGDCARGASELAEKQARMLSAVDADLGRVAHALTEVRRESVLQGVGICVALVTLIYVVL